MFYLNGNFSPCNSMHLIRANYSARKKINFFTRRRSENNFNLLLCANAVNKGRNRSVFVVWIFPPPQKNAPERRVRFSLLYFIKSVWKYPFSAWKLFSFQVLKCSFAIYQVCRLRPFASFRRRRPRQSACA